MESKIKQICDMFSLEGDYQKTIQLTNGNINITYKVIYNVNGEEKSYIIQRINKNIFTHPELIMQNISQITQHISSRFFAENKNYDKRNVLEYMSTADGVPYVIVDGEFWRCYRYIDKSVTFDSPTDLHMVEEAGVAFGQFQKMLSDFDASKLYVSIEDFHNTKKRFNDFIEAVNKDCVGRVNSVKEEIDYLLSMKDTASKLCELIDEGKLPLKVTHNDTKCNNVLFDKDTYDALAVIDLDTVMPGLTAYDYGDAIRSIASTATEDEIDLDKVNFDMNKFEAFTKGFMSKVSSCLTKEEVNSLSLGILVITLELASRFLKDYIEGDTYFKVTHSTHNLERARTQIKLAKLIDKKMPKIKEIINKYC